MSRTRVKICGLSRSEDVAAAVDAGADAVGFVCYEASPRYVPPAALERLAGAVPAFVSPVLLFVNARPAAVAAALARVPNALLQLHGDEAAVECERFGRPYLRAVRVMPDTDLLDCERTFASACALLADAPAEGFGGGGAVFEWSLLPPARSRTKPLVLAGGLNELNVARAIEQVRPYAVDVSSGVERARGIKSVEKIHRFVAAVRAADKELQQA